MPVLLESDLILKPLSMIDKSIKEGISWDSLYSQIILQPLQNLENSQDIPLLNHIPHHSLKDGQIVRFRGMIQDMFDPEYYIDECMIQNSSDGSQEIRSGRYRDSPVCLAHGQRILPQSLVHKDRHAYYSVSIPGQTDWIRQSYSHEVVSSPFILLSDPKKRSNDQNEEIPSKIQKCETEMEFSILHDSSVTKFDINYPIPDTPYAQAVILKEYGGKEIFSLNECVEVIGVLSIDPSFTSDEKEAFSHSPEEAAARCPPAFIVPRLHVLIHYKLNHYNPLLPSILSEEWFDETLPILKEKVLGLLSLALLGDDLAAEYLLCHIVSRVYARPDTRALGKFSLNIFRVPLHGDYVKKLSDFLSSLLTNFVYLPLSIEYLNNKIFIPKKDYVSNKLKSGILQLPKNTHLLLDETVMKSGRLQPEGLKNLTAIGNLINWQKVEYDFTYYPMEFVADVPCLILSEGRSMLPSDAQLPIRPVLTPSHSVIDECFQKIQMQINEVPETLNALRKYLTLVRFSEYELSEKIQNQIQSEFVNQRKEAGSSVTPEDLSQKLVLSKLFSQSQGYKTLTPETWTKISQMETARKERMTNLPPRTATAMGTSGINSHLANS